MKKILSLIIVMSVSASVQLMIALPWWCFLVPVFLLGIALPLKKWNISSFLLGFASGFFVWLLSTLYFEMVYKGEIINAVSKMIAVPNFLLYIIIGTIGGLLSGLALYSGFLLRSGKEILRLDLPKS